MTQARTAPLPPTMDLPGMERAAGWMRFPELGSRANLLGMARALAGAVAWSGSELEVLRAAAVVEDARLIDAVRAEILREQDPLGHAYCCQRRPDERRLQGQTFTPLALVRAMVQWAEREVSRVQRVVDPGAGSGRFTLHALRHFSSARGIAIETDPEVAILLRANLEVMGITDRVEVVLADFRDVQLPAIDGVTLFIGNPPYVRHHDIEPHRKKWYMQALARLGHSGSQLAGLHLHFFVRTLELATPGDVGCYVTAAEWLDTNYGRALRNLMVDKLGGRDLYVLDPTLPMFDDALVSAAVTGFFPHAQQARLRLVPIAEEAELLKPPAVIGIDSATAKTHLRWSALGRHEAPAVRPTGFVELGELFRVSRGQVTGLNRAWVQGPQTPAVPRRFLFPCITDAGDIAAVDGSAITDTASLRCVVDLPEALDALSETERTRIEAFLEWAKRLGAHKTYIAQHRRPWWCVRLKAPAPIVMTYMGRRPPLFAINPVGARIINIAHGLYPRVSLDDVYLVRLVRWLNANVPRQAGRVYAGGLTKFEPSEVMRLDIPGPSYFAEVGMNGAPSLAKPLPCTSMTSGSPTSSPSPAPGRTP